MIGHLLTEMKIGFESFQVREEGDMTGIRVRVNGENIRDFYFFYMQGMFKVVIYMYMYNLALVEMFPLLYLTHSMVAGL